MAVGFLRDSGALQGDSGFGGRFWSRSMERSQEEKREHVPEEAPIAIGAGEVESDGVKEKYLGVFL